MVNVSYHMRDVLNGWSVSRWSISLHVWMVVFLSVLFVMPTLKMFNDISWHDQQRILQIFIFVLVAFFSIFLVLGARLGFYWWVFPRHISVVMLCVFVGGGVSVTLSRFPLWGAVEYSVFLLLLQFSFLVAVLRRELGASFDSIILACVCLLCYVLVVGFLVEYIERVVWGVGYINIRQLFSGFSNVRFFGQFQTLTLPLLIAPVLLGGKSKALIWVCLVLCALWWLLAISSGTRGTWLGMGLAIGLVGCAGGLGRRWAALQILCSLLGLLLYLVLFRIVPEWLDIEVLHLAEDRLTGSLSMREVIWSKALDMIAENPVWGVGPMHFAEEYNAVAAHPHQSFLQWAAEWGLPSALAVLWLLGRGFIAVFWGGDEVRESSRLSVVRISVSAGILAAIVQSAVDGVLVMPVSQMWLALLFGWLCGISIKEGFDCASRSYKQWLWVGVVWVAVTVLLVVLVRDFSDLQERASDYLLQYPGGLRPRFWVQGFIY